MLVGVRIAGLALLLSLTGCIDPIDFAIGEPERRLVVDATLTDGPGPHVVRLNWPGGFQGLDALRPPARNAVVEVRDGQGNVYPAAEQSPGRYVIPEGALVAQVGGSYSLHVRIEDGRSYSSAPQQMPEPGEMASVQPSYERLPRLVGGVLAEIPSITIRLDASTDASEPAFLRWTWTGTWETEFCATPTIPTCFACWISEAGRSLVQIAETPLTSGQPLIGQLAAVFPLPEEPERFAHGFAVTVQQESMTQDAFRFWHRIREQRDAVGSLFDAPAGNVWGNMVNDDDPEDFTFGYFTVSSTRSETVCMRISDFPDRDPITMHGRFIVPNAPQACAATPGGAQTPPPGFLTLCGRPGG